MASKIPDAVGDAHRGLRDAFNPRNTIFCSYRRMAHIREKWTGLEGIEIIGDSRCPDNYVAFYDAQGTLNHIYLIKDHSNELHNDVVWC